MAVPMVSSAKGVTFGGFTCGVASLRVAGVALSDINSEVFCNVSKVVLCARRNTLVSFSQDELQFSWQAQHFGRVHFILRGRRSTLDVSCCVFFANRIVRAAARADKVQIPWQGWPFVRCDET